MLPLWDTEKLRRSTPVTGLLVTLNLRVFAAELLIAAFNPELFERLMGEYALVPAAWRRGWQSGGGWLPVGSSMFLHGGVAHVAGNMWFLWVFGRSLEARIGSFGFLLIYAVGGVGAALAQILTATDPQVPMVGASGAISAVLGAYLVLLPHRWIISLVPWIVPIIPVPAVVFLVLWFVVQLMNGVGSLQGAGSGGVAWWAHAGGFAFGMSLAALAGGRRQGRKT